MLNLTQPHQEIDKIVDFIRHTYTHHQKERAVIAVSGGIDSGLSLTLLTKALGPERVYPVFLPYQDQSTQNARLLAEFNQLPQSNWQEINIQTFVDQFWSDLSRNDQDDQPAKIRLGNIMARVRMIIVYDLAQKLSALVCGTENKSEHLLGYYTRFGDGASDLEPILHLYKTQVRQLAAALQLPEQIIDQPPSAGLWEGQTDQNELGFSYQDADRVLAGEGEVNDQVRQLVEKRTKSQEFKKEVPYSLLSK